MIFEAILVGSGARSEPLSAFRARTQRRLLPNEYLTRINSHLMKAYKGKRRDTLIWPPEGCSCRRRQRSHGRCSLRKAHGRRGSLHRIPPFREGASGSSRRRFTTRRKRRCVSVPWTAPLEVLSDENFQRHWPQVPADGAGRAWTHPAAAVRFRSRAAEFVLDLTALSRHGTSLNRADPSSPRRV